MNIDISKLPPGFKLELTKEDLIAFADWLLTQRNGGGNGASKNLEEEPIDVTEVATLINVSKAHVYFLTSNKKIPHVKKGKRCYFFKSDVLVWLKEDKSKTDKEIDALANEYLEGKRKKNK